MRCKYFFLDLKSALYAKKFTFLKGNQRLGRW